MINLLYDSPEILQALKTLVETRNVVRWPEIAKALEGMFDIHLSHPYLLANVYKRMKNPNNVLSQDQLKMLFKLVISNCGDLQTAHSQFQENSKLQIEYKKFQNNVYCQFKKALEIGIQIFINQKIENKKRLKGIPGSAIERVYNCKKIVQNDEFTQKLKRMSDVFSALYELSIDANLDDAPQLFDLVTSKIKKADFKLLLNSISFMFDLFCIKDRIIFSDDQLTPDYWLQPTIQENKALTVYKFYFGDDNKAKYEMFTQAIDVQQEIDFKFFVNKNPVTSKQTSSFQQKRAKLKTVRGRITLDDKKYRHERTILFNEEEEVSDQEFFELKLGRKQIEN